MVTIAELEILSRHLGMSLQVDPGINGRLWAYKQDGKTILSNKNFDDVSGANSMNFTVCQVKNDIISFHTKLQILLSQAQTIHQDFVDINTAYPALNIFHHSPLLAYGKKAGYKALNEE